MDLGESFYTGKTIAKVWKKEDLLEKEDADKEIGKIADSITRRFRMILEELGFSQEEIKWYKSKSDKNGSEPFIFISVDTPYQMKKLFKIFKKTRMNITSQERDNIIEYLTSMLPIVGSVQDLELIKHQEREDDMNDSTKTAKVPKHESLQSLSVFNEEIYSVNLYRKNKVVEIVCSYYVKDIDTRMTDFCRNRIFIHIDKNIIKKRSRQEICRYQYSLLNDWMQKFNFIMDKAEIVRITERYQNIHELCLTKNISKAVKAEYCCTGKTGNKELEIFCQEADWIGRSNLYRTLLIILQKEKQSNTVLENPSGDKQEEIMTTEEDCYLKCLDLAVAVSKHSLRKTSEKDFMYIMNYALEELEWIREEMLKRQMEEFYHLDLSRDISDFEVLAYVREQMEQVEEENRKYRMIDYFS